MSLAKRGPGMSRRRWKYSRLQDIQRAENTSKRRAVYPSWTGLSSSDSDSDNMVSPFAVSEIRSCSFRPDRRECQVKSAWPEIGGRGDGTGSRYRLLDAGPTAVARVEAVIQQYRVLLAARGRYHPDTTAMVPTQGSVAVGSGYYEGALLSA